MGSPSWFRNNFFPMLVWASCVPAFLVPRCLLKTGHNPPVGVYIAIMGGLAAFMTFRENIGRKEKAAWIVLITIFIVAEIQNLYIADAAQVAKFGKISDALDATSRGLDATAKGIDATARRLGDIAQSQQKIAGIASKTLLEEKGGVGYPWIVGFGPNSPAYPPSDDSSGKWALAVQNSDIDPLQGVMLEIQECPFGGDSMKVTTEKYRHRKTLQIGTVVSNKYGSHPINYSVAPGCYTIITTTRVARFTEYLWLGSLESGEQKYTVLDGNNKVIVSTR